MGVPTTERVPTGLLGIAESFMSIKRFLALLTDSGGGWQSFQASSFYFRMVNPGS